MCGSVACLKRCVVLQSISDAKVIQMSHTPPDLEQLAELIKEIRVAMMTTFPASPTDHFCHTRPMYTQKVDPKTFRGELLFLTDGDSGKIREIAGEARVLLTYADPAHNRYVSVLGNAVPEHNPTKVRELWNLMLKAWWPAGPDDPTIVLIRVRVDAAEFWDGPSDTMFTLRVLKSLVTGTALRDSMHDQLRADDPNHRSIVF